VSTRGPGKAVRRPPADYAEPLKGTRKPLGEMFYPQLFEFYDRLRSLREWDGRSEFQGFGFLFLGGALGGLFAGQSIVSAGVAASGVLGVGLLLGSLFIRRASSDSVGRITQAFERALSEYEAEDPEIKATRAHYDGLRPPEPTSRKGRLKAFFNIG
jgi:hypothetical protein